MHLSAQTLGLNSPLPIFFIFYQAEVDMEFFNFNQISPKEWKLIPMNNLHFTEWENVIFVIAIQRNWFTITEDVLKYYNNYQITLF